jgi:hypothetical protein
MCNNQQFFSVIPKNFFVNLLDFLTVITALKEAYSFVEGQAPSEIPAFCRVAISVAFLLFFR